MLSDLILIYYCIIIQCYIKNKRKNSFNIRPRAMSGVASLTKLIFFSSILYKVCQGFNVSLTNGDIKGEKIITMGLNLSYSYYAFRGIPYAEPPIGNLRFAEPVAKKPWNGTLDATNDGLPCIQKTNPVQGSEDCLFLNVYTPITVPGCALFPVLVYIYGGSFDGGNNTLDTYSPDYLIEQNIVVVTINYRIGIFGFASTGDSVVPGNNGLKDQQLALLWIQDNIQQFCGNPNDVTISGQSAGSVSVSYHLQSQKSQGLFHKAIMQSGVSLCLWGLSTTAAKSMKNVAKNLKLNSSTSEVLIEGLRNISAARLQLEASSVASIAFIGGNMRKGFVWGPVSEPPNPNQFYSGQSYEVLASGNVAKVPVLLGYNNFEAGYIFNCKK